MKIAFEGQTFCKDSRTGVGRYTYSLIRKIIELDRENRYEINIFDFLGRNRSRQRLSKLFGSSGNVSLRTCRFLPYGAYVRKQELFKAVPYNLLLGSNADIVHFFNFVIPYNINSRTVNTVHDMTYIRYPETMSRTNYNIHRKNLRRSCRDADIILTVSQNSKREIAEFMDVPPDRIEVAYPAVDREIFRPHKDFKLIREKYRIPGDYFLYFGTLEPRKNITSIIKAFKIIAEKNKGISLVLAGQKGWMYDEIFRLVKDLGLDDRVIFTGYVPEEDAPALYSCAQAFVFPSLYEGFGIPPLEAMACGTPVIVSNTASLPEVVGDAGILAEPLDVEGIAFEMERLLNDGELRKQCIEKGMAQADRFSWEQSARKVIEIYNSLA